MNNIQSHETKKVSVIIPVHNGEAFLKRTVKGVLSQSLKNIELILVENGSKDNSFELCKSLEKTDKRIKTLKSEFPGTSLARKMGIEAAAGEFVYCADQDDRFSDNSALENMYRTIVQDDADICVFGFNKEYLGVIRKQKHKSEGVFSRADLLNGEIKGVMGVKSDYLDTPVWNKIYRSEVIKEAVSHIEDSLFFAEDEYLNILAFSSPATKKVTIHDFAFYNWQAQIGFSSSPRSGWVLLQDYKIVKPLAIKIISDYFNDPDSVLWDVHLESLYCMKSVFFEMISSKMEESEVVANIQTADAMPYIQTAKTFFKTYPDRSRVWKELEYMAGEYSAKEYYDFVIASAAAQNVRKKKIIDFAKKLARFVVK